MKAKIKITEPDIVEGMVLSLTPGESLIVSAALDAIMGEPTEAHYPSWFAQIIKMIPSAKPKVGEWVEIENGEYLCSNCLHITIGYPPSNCPNCGSFNGG